MNMMSKEVRWALCGFIGGFVLCYLLIGAFDQTRQPNRPVELTQLLIPSPVSSGRFTINLDKPQAGQKLTPAAPHYRVSIRQSPELRNVPAGTVPDTYSTELIDGRNQSRK